MLGAASLLPGTLWAVFLCLAMGVFLAGLSQNNISLARNYFLFGLSFHILAFYWLPQTVQFFGGFPLWAAYAVFALFCATAALQFAIFAMVYKRLQQTLLQQYCLALPGAWLLSEFLFPRLFPWTYAHHLVALPAISGVAEYIGIYPLSALLLWVAEAGYWGLASLRRKQIQRGRGIIGAALALSCCLFVGTMRNREVEKEIAHARTVNVALIQGNLAAKEKGDVKYLDVNIERYRELSHQAVARGAQVLFWPESVVNHWIGEEQQTVRGKQFDPAPDLAVPLVFGTLSYRREGVGDSSSDLKYYNAALAIDVEGKILGRYYKRILMPFGEYIPFAEYYPQLKEISPQTGDFSKGDLSMPIAIGVNGRSLSDQLLRVGVLICYEDLISAMSSELVNHGANILVNLTNDAWYGKTAAPYQHHLLAQWRAIETRRYLLRVTNTGLTAVVDPLGRTLERLPIFEEAVLQQEVRLLESATVYSDLGDGPIWALSLLLVILAIFGPKVSVHGRNRS